MPPRSTAASITCTGRWSTRTTSTGARTSRTEHQLTHGNALHRCREGGGEVLVGAAGVADPDRGAAIGFPEFAGLDAAEPARERVGDRVHREARSRDASRSSADFDDRLGAGVGVAHIG